MTVVEIVRPCSHHFGIFATWRSSTISKHVLESLSRQFKTEVKADLRVRAKQNGFKIMAAQGPKGCE
jgi:hypothetical protein